MGLGFLQATLTIQDRCQYVSSQPLAYVNDKYVISEFTFTVRDEYAPVPEPALGWATEAAVCLAAGWINTRRTACRP